MKIESEMNAGIGARLKKIRKTFCLTQAGMGRILNSTKSRYFLLEHGKVLPTIQDYLLLRKKFDISAGWFFTGIGEKYKAGFLKSQLMGIDEEDAWPVEPDNETEQGKIQDLLYLISKDRVLCKHVLNHFKEVKMSIEGSK